MLNHGQSAFPAQLWSALPSTTSSSSGAPNIGNLARPALHLQGPQLQVPVSGAQLPVPCLSSVSHFQVLSPCPISKSCLYVPSPFSISMSHLQVPSPHPTSCPISTSHLPVPSPRPISMSHLHVPFPGHVPPTICTAVTPAAALTTNHGGTAPEPCSAHQDHSAGLRYDRGRAWARPWGVGGETQGNSATRCHRGIAIVMCHGDGARSSQVMGVAVAVGVDR